MPAPYHSVFYRPDALLLPNQQRQSTEGIQYINTTKILVRKAQHTNVVLLQCKEDKNMEGWAACYCQISSTTDAHTCLQQRLGVFELLLVSADISTT